VWLSMLSIDAQSCLPPKRSQTQSRMRSLNPDTGLTPRTWKPGCFRYFTLQFCDGPATLAPKFPVCSLAILGLVLTGELGRLIANPQFGTISGVVDNQVFQRNTQGTATFLVEGVCGFREVKQIEFRVLRRGRALPGFDGVRAGSVDNDKWSIQLTDLPIGGPYDIEFLGLDGSNRVISRHSIHNILVGDLWVLAGQSNMHGRGDIIGAASSDERIHNFDLSDHWSVAKEPVGSEAAAVDRAHWPSTKPSSPEEIAVLVAAGKRGAGPGMFFAKEMLRRTEIPIGLIPCAKGATSLEQWSPAGKAQEGNSLYGSLLRRVASVGGRICGVLWYQGESDAFANESASYGARFRKFIESLRADLAQGDLPFYYVQLGRNIAAYSPSWNEVQLAQLQTEQSLKHVGLVAAVDLELKDSVHVAVGGLERLGQRLANLACRDLFSELKDTRNLQRGPRVVSAHVNGPGDEIVVKFSGVNGRLRSDGRPEAFSLCKTDGSDVFGVYRARLDPSHPAVVLLDVRPQIVLSELRLWYGWGNDPSCSLVDDRDMAVPVFGPLPIHAQDPTRHSRSRLKRLLQ